MKWVLAWTWVLVAACSFEAPRALETDAGGVPGEGCMTFSTQLDTCALPSPFPLTLAGMLTFNTDTGVLMDAANIETPVVSRPVATRGAEVTALVASTVHLMPGTILRAIGVRGLAIVASDTITLGAGARIDVSGGAGRRDDCGPTAAGAGANDDDGGAGGGGGGLGAAGGLGGTGDLGSNPSTGGAAGMAAAAIPDGPIGGCPGGRGGNGDNENNVGGPGGLGGGAVYLVSAVAIGIGPDAGIAANGQGGQGGRCVIANGDAGGGGGGSGGSIFLEAPRLRIDGILAANGGGGGEGSGGGVAGQPGSPGAFGVMPAPGGHNTSGSGARGGTGGHVTIPVGGVTTEVLAGGGGGGGGGVGVIRISSPDPQLGAMVSPAPS